MTLDVYRGRKTTHQQQQQQDVFSLSFTLFALMQHGFNFLVPETNIAEFANSIDLDEVAHNEIYTVCTLVFEFSI